LPHAPAATAHVEPRPAAPATGGRWRVQLGAFSSEAGARHAWSIVSARMGGLEPIFSRAGALTRLQAGPLADRAAADRACTQARSGGLACFAVAP
jgi:cell division septation protein DedD